MKKIILTLGFLLSLSSCEKVRNTSYQSTNLSILMNNNVNFF